MKRLLILVILCAGCVTPGPFNTARIDKAIAKDPILRWKCPDGTGHSFTTNNTGWRELPRAVRARCRPIRPVKVKI